MIIMNPMTGHRFYFDDTRFDGIINFTGAWNDGVLDKNKSKAYYYVPKEDGFRQVPKESIKDSKRCINIQKNGGALLLPCINDSMSLDFNNLKLARTPDDVECRILLFSFENGKEIWKECGINIMSYSCLFDFQIDINSEIGMKTLIDLNNAFPKAKILGSLCLNDWNRALGEYPYIPDVPELQVQDVLFHVDSYKKSAQYKQLVDQGFGYLAFVDGTKRNLERNIDMHGLIEDLKEVGNRQLKEMDVEDIRVAARVKFGKPRAVFLKLMLGGFSAYDISLFCEVFTKEATGSEYDKRMAGKKGNLGKYNRLTEKSLQEYRDILPYMPSNLMTKLEEMAFLKRFANPSPDEDETRMEEFLDILKQLRLVKSKREIVRILQKTRCLKELRALWEVIQEDFEENKKERIAKIINVDLPQNRFKRSCEITESMNGDKLELITSIDELSNHEMELMTAGFEFQDSDLIYRRTTDRGTSSLLCISLEEEEVYLVVFMMASREAQEAQETIARVEEKHMPNFKLKWLSSKMDMF